MEKVLKLKLGEGFKLTVRVAVAVQPAAVDPSTVYTVAAVGLTATVVPLTPIGLQVYVLAPVPVSTVLV